MSSVTKRIDFCYGHRLLDYDGICKHPHGHNAVAEIEVRTDHARQPQHGLRLQRHQAHREGLDRSRARSQDDAPARRSARRAAAGSSASRCICVDSNPTVERIARLIFDYAHAIEEAAGRRASKVWETPTSFAEYGE